MWDGAKATFAAAWVALQGALIATSGERPDAAFGFRMFSESSTIEVKLFRETADGARVEVDGGEWVAKDRDGAAHRISWGSHVKEPNLTVFGVTMHAAYGAAAQVQRWSAALDYVAHHIPEDVETRALELELGVRRNGRPKTGTHVQVRR
jgi:hypothetical protein